MDTSFLRRIKVEEILQVFTRLNALLEQYDQVENNLSQGEMQMESLYRLPSTFEKEASEAKSNVAKAVKTFVAQRDATRRAIEDITGLSPGDLRDRINELKVALE